MATAPALVSTDSQKVAAAVANAGFAVVNDVINSQTIDSLIHNLNNLSGGDAVRKRGGSPFGIRDLLNVVPAVKTLAEDDGISSFVKAVMGNRPKLVRGLFFDKTSEANWKVVWHQDLTIAVRRRRDVVGFGPWTVKAGTVHVQPPVTVLEDMVAVRIHLDDTNKSNGALRVIPESHKQGRLTQAMIQRLMSDREAVLCAVARGGVLLMRPLLLHSSSAGSQPGHRRVIHLEYSGSELPNGLVWSES